MNSPSSIVITIDLTKPFRFSMPVPVNPEIMERDKVAFHMVSEDQAISLLGTYDQIMNFCAEVGQKMMSWPIVSGHMEWLAPRGDLAEKVSDDNRDGSNDGQVGEVRDGSAEVPC